MHHNDLCSCLCAWDLSTYSLGVSKLQFVLLPMEMVLFYLIMRNWPKKTFQIDNKLCKNQFTKIKIRQFSRPNVIVAIQLEDMQIFSPKTV